MSDQTHPFDIIDDVTKDMLEESGEVQRAYTVVTVYDNAYDFYTRKHSSLETRDLHLRADQFAMNIVSITFGGK